MGLLKLPRASRFGFAPCSSNWLALELIRELLGSGEILAAVLALPRTRAVCIHCPFDCDHWHPPLQIVAKVVD